MEVKKEPDLITDPMNDDLDDSIHEYLIGNVEHFIGAGKAEGTDRPEDTKWDHLGRPMSPSYSELPLARFINRRSVQKAIFAELCGLLRYDDLEIISESNTKRMAQKHNRPFTVISTRFLLHLKTPTKFKGRMAQQGLKDPNVYKLPSPTAGKLSFRLLLHWVVTNPGKRVAILDVTKAFLQSKTYEDDDHKAIFVTPPNYVSLPYTGQFTSPKSKQCIDFS